MTPSEYQLSASRTECDQRAAAIRTFNYNQNQNLLATRLNHAALGMAGEIGEFAYAIEKWLQYGTNLDIPNLVEELGDILWYLALACNAISVDMGLVMENNIAKLKVRYPEKYSDTLAAEENRNRELERNALLHNNDYEQTGNGFAELPEESNEVTSVTTEEVDHWRTNNYSGVCERCKLPIHKNNSSGFCPDCAAYYRGKLGIA